MNKLIFILLLFLSFTSMAQQGLQMEFTEQDSMEMIRQREIEYRQFISGKAFDANLLDENFKLPDFNFQVDYHNPYNLSFTFNPISNYNFGGISSGMTNPFYSSFYGNATVLSAGAYQIGDKFTMGGYSYGTNSIFSAPSVNRGLNNFDSYGSTFFMQYKVSKNFKIETRVNVQQGGVHPGF